MNAQGGRPDDVAGLGLLDFHLLFFFFSINMSIAKDFF